VLRPERSRERFSIPNVAFVKLDLIGLEECAELPLKRLDPVMLALIADVGCQKISRPFRPQGWGTFFFPRASAFGLSPGLGSLGPLGRWIGRQTGRSTRQPPAVSSFGALAPGSTHGAPPTALM
jgi:hypothetical protein